MKLDVDIDEERMKEAVNKLGAWRDEINEKLKEEFEEYKDRAKSIHPQGVRTIDRLEDYTLRGGKRVRPALIIAGYEGVGGQSKEKILSASLSIEALQSYLLIHDDIMDEDELRRGEPTLHKMYEKHYKENFKGNRPEKFGRDMGIVAGDIANSFAISKLAKSNFQPSEKIEAIRKFEEIHRHTGYGQTLDVIFNEKEIKDVDEKDILTIHLLKTAQYTMAGPLEIGAILGEGKKKQKDILREYGINMGKAFQIYDDMLGLYGNEEKLGKPIGSDLKEGKKTLLIIKALEKCNEKQRDKILEAMGNKDISKEDVKEIREIVRETGSYDYSRKLTVKFAKRGKNALDKEQIKPEIVEFLKGLGDYIITREV